MKKLKIFLFLLVATLGSWSCSKTKILTATFESDPVNGLPSKDLVGFPSGDSIKYHDGIQPQLSVQNSTLSGFKALHFAKIFVDNPPPTESAWLSFRGIGTDLTQTLTFSFTGQNNYNDVSIEVSDGHGHPMARIRIFGDGAVYLSPDVGSFSEFIGNVHSDNHTIVFTMFTSSLKYNVTITQASGTTVAENKPMITDNLLSFNNPAHPTVGFLHTPHTLYGGVYVIGSVDISRKKP